MLREGVRGDRRFRSAELSNEAMKAIFATLTLSALLSASALGAEQAVLARVTAYWRGGSSGEHASWSGARLHVGHCAVDPDKIPYGSKVFFADATCTAVDTGPDVVNRKAARLSGRSQRERNAIVVDRFFETKKAALAWIDTHPHFMTLRVITPERHSKRTQTAVAIRSTITPRNEPAPSAARCWRFEVREMLARATQDVVSRDARRRTGADVPGRFPPSRRYDDSFA